MVKMRLKAETLIQAIVAALIFMVIFLISLETVVRITTSQDDAYTLVDADYQISLFFAELSDGKHTYGNYVKYFSGGKLTAEISQYQEYTNLQIVTVTAELNKIKKHITFRHIVESTNE
jgi:hypothetical protein